MFSFALPSCTSNNLGAAFSCELGVLLVRDEEVGVIPGNA